MKNLVKYFNARSNLHLIIIFIIFGISGSLSVLLSDPFLNYINLKQAISIYPLYLILRILIIFPIYQIVLIVVAIIFGEFKYFIEFEKKFFKRLKIF